MFLPYKKFRIFVSVMRKTLLSLFTLFLLAPSLSSLPPGDRDISLWDQGGQVICQTQV